MRAIVIQATMAVLLGVASVSCIFGSYSLAGSNEGSQSISVPDEEQLRTKYRQRDEALNTNDFKVLYYIRIKPEFRKEVSLDEFKKWYQLTNREFKTELVKVCACRVQKSGMRCSLLSHWIISAPDEQTKDFKILESGEYVDGTWYLTYTDHHMLDECP